MEFCLWILFFMLFPDLNVGLLSDYKICGDPECESPMSRVQAVKSHEGKDCRFLNFRRGDTIFVYHKLTGKREDFWAGSIDKQFGYFPKDAVREEEIFATMRKVLETQESDFLCMDESGYPLDTSHLDTDEDDDLNFQDHEPESSQISPHSHDTNAQGTLTSTESTVKEREDEGVDAAELLEDELKTSAIPEQQGGSPSSSWLRSSMTGWLGFAKEEQSGDSEQEAREDVKEETKSEASLTSSVTGWLGFGGEDKPNKDEDSVKGREDTFTSTMTGWLGFGEEKKTVALENKENEETGDEKEPTETFRSRRMSLDLEGSKLQEEEKEDMGTMGWLGSGLASRLGFGSSGQDSEREGVEVQEEKPSSSWMEMGIGDIWGIGGSNTGADGSKESGIRETERDQMLEQSSGFENVDVSQSEASVTEEIKAENVPYTLPFGAESGDAAEDNIDHSNTEDANNLDIDAGILNKDDSIHNSSQVDDENIGEHNMRNEQISQNNEYTERPEISSDPDHSLEELHSNSMEQLEDSMKESENHEVQIEAPGSLEEEGAEVTNQVHKIEGSTLMSENSPANRDNHIEEHFNEVTGQSQQEILGVQSELPEETQVSGDQVESSGQSQLGSSSLQGEVGLQQETQTQTMEVTSNNDGPLLSGNTESLHDSVSEEGLSETKPNIYTTKESLQIVRDGDVDRFKETVKDQHELTEEETSDSENEDFNGNQMKSTIVSERETEDGLKEEEKVQIDKQEEVEVQEQIEEVKQEQKMKLESLNKQETEKEEEMGDISEEDMELREEGQEEIEELEKPVEELSEHGHQIREEEIKESEEQNKKEEKVDVFVESSNQEGMELAEERQKDIEEVEEGEKSVEELPEHGHQIRVEELKELEEENEKEEKVGVFVESSNQEGMELAEERQKEMEVEGEKLETALLEHEQVSVERLKESVEPNEIGQDEEENMSGVFRASSSQEGAELAEERQKEMEEVEEGEKSVAELTEDGHQIRVEELKELEEVNEKEEEVDIFADSSNQEGMELAEERQKEMEELTEGEKWTTVLVEHGEIQVERLNESVEPNETEQEEEMSEVSEESSGQEEMELTEEREKDAKKLNEEDEQVEELQEHGHQIRVEELKELEKQNENKIVDDSGEMENQQIGDVLLGDEQGTLERLEESEEQNKQAKEEVENQVWEERLEHKQTDMLDNSSLASLASETNTQTEIQKDEEQEEKEVEKQNKEELEEENEHPTKEVEDDNVDVDVFEDGERTGTTVNDDGDWKEDRQDNDFEEETRKTFATKTENELYKDREEMHDSAESQVQTAEQTESTDPPQGADSESRGAFGLLKNTLGFFSQTPTPEMSESTQSVHNVNPNEAEPSQPHPSITPELASPTDSFHAEVTHAAFPTEHPQTDPLSAEKLPSTAHLVTKEPSKTKPLTKHYKNLLRHMNADEAVILEDLFGRHKLQFLDYILTSSEAATAEDDQSILLDIERLLQHNMETLVAPSMSITDAPQEDKQRTSAIIALQKLETLLKTVKETVSTGISDVSNHQVEHSSSQEKEDNSKSASLHKDDDDDDGKYKDWNYEEEERRVEGSKDNIASLHLSQPGSKQKGVIEQTLELIHRVAEDSKSCVQAVMEILVWIHVQAVSLLPDDMRPGPDLYGVPWEPVIFTVLVGLVTFLLFTRRCYRSIKSRLYRKKEERLAGQLAQLLDEKCKVLETLSQCQKEHDDLENVLRDGGVLAQTQKSQDLEGQAEQLEQTKKQLGTDLGQLKEQLSQQQEHRKEQERRITLLEESMKACDEETKELHSKEEQAQTTLKVYSMNSERLQRNLETAEEENTVLQESNNQLKQEVEGWAERVSELEEEMRRCEVAHSAMLQDVAVKDDRITSLTDRLLRMKCWESDLEGEEGGEKEATNGRPGEDDDAHLQKVQKLIFAAKLNADLKSVDEDKDRVFAKLNDEIKAKEDLQVSIEEMEKEKLSLQSDAENYTGQVERIQQKLQIMTEMYQENELKLHRMLTVEEKERHQKEEKLNKADKNIAMAMEELNNYRKRAEEMEEELEKTKQSYQTQISAHEKKAHNNWLAARSAERELGDFRRENALLRQKLTDTQFKLDSLDKDPYALNNLARPLPFRAERSPYGPSPLGRPSSETRPFLSPPILMDGLPGRLSPRGYMFPEPGGPMFRRPPPGALGPLPPGPLPPGPMPPRGLPMGPPHPLDMADGSFRENRLGPGEQDHRESGPGGQRTPPELDLRMGGPPPPGPPGIPIDGPFPRRAPYGPPPDFYHPRIPGGPPMRPMWPSHPQGMMLPPRFSPGGPLPPAPNPNTPYGPPMALHPSDGPPPPRQQSLPLPPQNQSPENRPSPEDAI
ncbi:cTAGE family member 5 isoform X2 [Poecilia reticulata]|uniref:cTAGE family member 5 isoform X2 n=1 Tax=Poecilia reticulata TaxID=8081 RepID=UPI0004A2F927|nr:PREDICTED: cTAGE family member 5 isoform X2 [Poecilia reticulata]